jgi:hypothetical protein
MTAPAPERDLEPGEGNQADDARAEPEIEDEVVGMGHVRLVARLRQHVTRVVVQEVIEADAHERMVYQHLPRCLPDVEPLLHCGLRSEPLARQQRDRQQ